jgi:hypothetical protein
LDDAEVLFEVRRGIRVGHRSVEERIGFYEDALEQGRGEVEDKARDEVWFILLRCWDAGAEGAKGVSTDEAETGRA